jgi:hypothetical protein
MSSIRGASSQLARACSGRLETCPHVRGVALSGMPIERRLTQSITSATIFAEESEKSEKK